MNDRNARGDCFDNEEVQHLLSDDGVGATTEEDYDRGNDDGIVERRTANAQPKERHKGNIKTGESSYKCIGEPASQGHSHRVDFGKN